MRKELTFFASVIVLSMLIAACGGPAPTPTPEPTRTPLPVPTATPKPTQPPALPQAVAGETAFNNYCGGCHGTGFAKSILAKYGTAHGLFEFVSMSMPPGNPDTLDDQSRYDIIGYLLTSAGFIDAGQEVSADTAATITLPEPAEPPGTDQVTAGKKAFGRYCGGCHGGGFSESVIARYGTAEKLFQFLRVAMPPGNPQQVSEQGHYDIVSYILSEQGMLPPGQEVSADTAAGIALSK
jgi:mono/diheme cytochrome c family protein